MPTNLAIEDRLLKEALQIGGCRSKKEAVIKRWRSLSSDGNNERS